MSAQSPQPLRSGFTLIELLVVIAIIAILAAILFPVFAKVREKARQTSCMSNLKQDALGITQYVQDNDEEFPLAQPHNSSGWINSLFTTPPTLRPGSTALRSIYWSNSIQPYIKSLGTYTCPSGVPWLADDPPVAGEIAVSYTYNGYLQSSTQAAVLAPASVIMLWSGTQKTSLLGYAYANPVLNCGDKDAACVYVPPVKQATETDPAECATGNGADDSIAPYGGLFLQYDPSGYVQPSYSAWIHGPGDNFCFADGHVKWSPLHGDPNVDPYVPANDQGDAFDPATLTGSYWYDGCHATLFRPDNVP
jgi:prepilin-type N-terminal cleavage/methylation domain-containing protein/prepilin-type processing-associated H-X9-DG protein